MGFATLLTLPTPVVGPTTLALADQLMLRASRPGVLPGRNGVRQG
ncbi:hypothetical protein [Streptomyces sp. NPDC001770]